MCSGAAFADGWRSIYGRSLGCSLDLQSLNFRSHTLGGVLAARACTLYGGRQQAIDTGLVGRVR